MADMDYAAVSPNGSGIDESRFLHRLEERMVALEMVSTFNHLVESMTTYNGTASTESCTTAGFAGKSVQPTSAPGSYRE